MAYFILVKRANAKSYLGAIPVKKGVRITALRKRIAKSRKKGYSYRIVKASNVKSYLSTLIKKKASSRKTARKKKR